MADPVQDLADKIAPRLADAEHHSQMLRDLLQVARDQGAKGLKKLVKDWVAQAKAKEGLQ